MRLHSRLQRLEAAAEARDAAHGDAERVFFIIMGGRERTEADEGWTPIKSENGVLPPAYRPPERAHDGEGGGGAPPA